VNGYRVEGGPLNGGWVDWDSHIVRYPVKRPSNLVDLSRPSQPTFDVVEYRREGSVYRYEGMIGDCWAEASIAEQIWCELPQSRREIRSMIRRALEKLAPDKEVDRVVWTVSRDKLRGVFTVAGFVGGSRSENAAHFRKAWRA